MEVVQTVEHPNFETIWALLRENAEDRKKSTEEWEQWHKKSAEEWEQRHKKNDEEWEQRHKKNDEEWEKWRKEIKKITKENARLIGKLGGRLGDMIEHLVAPNLVKKFGELGVVFEKAYQNAKIKDKKNNIFAEADITLENSEKVMIIEVKSKLATEDITEHVERMGKMRVYADKHGDKRKFLGAVAAMVMTDNEKAFAFKNGFYVLEPSGDTFTIAVPEGNYSVKEY
jgi:predicted RNase H-related nuclease YkuK (DUF458 family)